MVGKEFTFQSGTIQANLSMKKIRKQSLIYIPIWYNSGQGVRVYGVNDTEFTFQSGTIQAGEERNVIEMRYIDFTFQSGTIQAIDAYTI